MRDLNSEFQDTDDRKYAYEFDYIHRHFMMKGLEHLFTGSDALEMGCYHGEFSKLLLDRFAHLTIVEGASDLVAITEENLSSHSNQNFAIHNAYFEDVELSKQYDAIFLVHTLEHLDHPTVVLQRMQSWLKPTGKIFIVVPNANAASRQIAVAMNLIEHNQSVTEGEYKHGHRKTYALDTLVDEVRAAGLTPLAQGGILFKGLANFQMDRALESGIIDLAYLEGCYHLGHRYPDLCASVYVVCQ